MYENLSTGEIRSVIDDLAERFGLWEDTNLSSLASALSTQPLPQAIAKLALHFHLPIDPRVVELREGDYSFSTGDSRSLVSPVCNNSNRGEIAAQVLIPAGIPIFGSEALHGFPVEIRVRGRVRRNAFAFLALMAHELSHVLFACQRSPYSSSELHADLLPLVLGLRHLVMKGRQTNLVSRDESTVKIRTTTYGYLSDEQFDVACEHVAAALSSRRTLRNTLIGRATEARRALRGIEERLASVPGYMSHLAARPASKISAADARELVELHSQDSVEHWRDQMNEISRTLSVADEFARSLTRYDRQGMAMLGQHLLILESGQERLDQLADEVYQLLALVRRCSGLVFRLRMAYLGRQED